MKPIQILLTLLLAALFTACASPSFEDEPAGEFADQGLYPVRSTGFREVHARRDAGLTEYRTLAIEPLDLDNVAFSTTNMPGTVARDWQITPQRERVLTDAWASAMERAFADYDRSGESEKVLRVHAELQQVRPRRRSATGPTPAGVPATPSGDLADIFIEIRLYDRASGDLLAVIRDNRDVPVLQWTQADGRNMLGLFNSWASLLHARVSGR
jgi:hypothetical protein